MVEHGQAWSLVACPNPARFVLMAHTDTLNFFVDGTFSAIQSAYSNIETLPCTFRNECMKYFLDKLICLFRSVHAFFSLLENLDLLALKALST